MRNLDVQKKPNINTLILAMNEETHKLSQKVVGLWQDIAHLFARISLQNPTF